MRYAAQLSGAVAHARALGVALLLSVGCGNGPAGSDAVHPDAGPPPGLEEPPAFVRVAETTTGSGDVYGIAIEAQLRRSVLDIYTEIGRVGSCVLFEADLGFCENPCDGVCTSGGTCLPFPEQLSAGTLSLTGLSAPVSIEFEPGDYYYHYDAALSSTPGGVITASGPGVDIAAFEVAARAPTPLQVPGLTDLELVELAAGRDLVIEWTPADPDARVRLELRSDTAEHGLYPPAVILCDVPDTGALTVPQSLIDPFTDPGYWGCSDCISSFIERYAYGSVETGDDRIELHVSSRVSLYPVVD